MAARKQSGAKQQDTAGVGNARNRWRRASQKTGQLLAENFLDVELHWLKNVPASWEHADSGDGPDFPENLFCYEVDVMLYAPSEDAEEEGGAGEDGEEAGVLFRHTFTYGRLHNITPEMREKVDPAPESTELTTKHHDAARVVSPSSPPVGNEPVDALDAPGTEDATPAPLPLGVMWLWHKPAPEPEADPAEAKGKGKKDPKGKAKDDSKTPQTATSQTPEPVEAPSEPAQPNHVARIPLTPPIILGLERAAESGGELRIVLRRCLGPKVPTDWEDANEARYRGIASVPLAIFSEPGMESKIFEEVMVQPDREGEEVSGGDKGKGKDKKPPPKKAGKGGTAAPPFLSQAEDDDGESHPYEQNGTNFRLRLSVTSPLVCLPQKRPRPSRMLSDMVRRRVKQPKRPPDIVTQYHQRVTQIVHALVDDFLARNPSGGDGTRPTCGDDQRRDFLEYIGTSGKHRRELRDGILKVVREHFGKKAGESPQAMEQFYDELYTFLIEQMHLVLNRIFSRDKLAVRHDGGEAAQQPAARWLRLATEAEVVQEFGVAARYHQERLAGGPDPSGSEDDLPSMWTDYARFCLRTRDAVKAEEAFREAITFDSGDPEPSHLPSLLGLGLLLLSRDRLEEAEVCVQAAVDADMGNPLTWGCLAIYHERVAVQDEEHEERHRHWAKYARLFADRAAAGKSPPATEGAEVQALNEPLDLALARYTCDLWLEDLTEHCLGNLEGPDSQDVMLLRGQMHFQLQELDDARDWLENRLLKKDKKHLPALVLLGDVYASMDGMVQMKASDGSARTVPALVVSEEYYDRALRIDEYGATGPAYVRLGNIYNSLGRYEDARDAFLVGAKVWPCGLTWMGVGISYYRLEDMRRAEQALCESNILNNLNPKTWAYLCLVCLRSTPLRTEQADRAFDTSVKLGLRDADLLAEIGVEQQHVGRVQLAEAAFLRSLSIRDCAATRLLLANTLVAMRRFDAAAKEFRTAKDRATRPAEKARAERELEALLRLDTTD